MSNRWVEEIKSNPNKTEFNFNWQEIGDKHVKQLFSYVSKNRPDVQTIYLGDNNIGAVGARYIAEYLKYNSSLTHINLESNNIGVDGAQYIAESLKCNSSLTHIDLGYNIIGADGAKISSKIYRRIFEI